MFPIDFLIQIAERFGLSSDQTDVFVRRFGGKENYTQIAKDLGTTPSACIKRMGHVYEKFSIYGKSRGKQNLLRQELSKLFSTYAALKQAGAPNSSSLEHKFDDGPVSELNKLYTTLHDFQSISSEPSVNRRRAEMELSQWAIEHFAKLLPAAVNSVVTSKNSIDVIAGAISQLVNYLQTCQSATVNR